MLCQNETQVVNTDNSCEPFQLETFIWRQNPPRWLRWAMKMDNVLAARNNSSVKCRLFVWKKKKRPGWSARPQTVIVNEL